MKNIILIGKIVLILLSLLLMNCEKQDHLETIETIGVKKFTKITLQELKNKVIHNETFENISNSFDVNLSSTSNQRKESLDNAIVLTDEIVEVQGKTGSDYTFKMITNSKAYEFYNLVVSVNDQGVIIDSKIIKYTPSESWISDPSLPFSGNASLIERNNFLDVDSKYSRGRRCVVGIITEWVCNAGNNHPPDSCPAGGSELIVTLVYGDCPPALDDEMDDTGTPFDTSGSSGGGGSNGGSGAGTNTTPLPPCGFTFDGNYGNDCLGPDEYNLALELNAAGVHDYEFDNSINPDQVPNFNSVEEMLTFFENFVGSQGIDVIQQTTISKFSFEMNSILGTDLRFIVQTNVPTPTIPLDILSVDSSLIGITAFQDWEQDEIYGEYNLGVDEIVLTMTGTYKRGAILNGQGIYISVKYHFIVKYNRLTGVYLGSWISNIEY